MAATVQSMLTSVTRINLRSQIKDLIDTVPQRNVQRKINKVMDDMLCQSDLMFQLCTSINAYLDRCELTGSGNIPAEVKAKYDTWLKRSINMLHVRAIEKNLPELKRAHKIVHDRFISGIMEMNEVKENFMNKVNSIFNSIIAVALMDEPTTPVRIVIRGVQEAINNITPLQNTVVKHIDAAYTALKELDRLRSTFLFILMGHKRFDTLKKYLKLLLQ